MKNSRAASSSYDSQDLFWKTFASRPGNPYLLAQKLNGLKTLFLFVTRETDRSRDDFPIALGYMASLVRMNGGTADIRAHDITAEHAPSSLAPYQLVCIYPMVASLTDVFALSAEIRQANPNAKICLFNSEQHQHEMLLNSPQASSLAEQMMELAPSIDVILVGESEWAFIHLCGELASGQPNLQRVPSCVYREQGTVRRSPTQIKSVDFEFLPFPARDFLEQGKTSEGYNLRSPRIQSARGCVAPCLYCIESTSNITANGRKVPLLRRRIEDFVDEIEALHRNFHVVFFNVIDSSFEDAGKRGIERMNAFCDEMQKREIQASFKIHLRAETVCKLTDELLAKLKATGVDVVGIGVESGLPDELASYKKIATVDESRRAVLRVEARDRFFCIVGHMMFSPVLELEDLPKKVDFLKEINRCWDYLDMSNNVIIFPGTAYHQAMMERGLVYDYERFSGSVPYRFKDPRVENIASSMGELKGRCPNIIEFNNKIYDAMNIASRFQNSMNRHLQAHPEPYQQFRERVEQLRQEASAVLSTYFLELVELARRGWDAKEAESLYARSIPLFYDSVAKDLNEEIDRLVETYEKAKLSTTRLTLRTWMSIINTEVNTASGRSQ